MHSACALTQQNSIFFFKQNQYKHMMSACPSDLNVSGENSVARGSCSESEPVGKEDFSPAGFKKTDGVEILRREVSVLLGRCAALTGSLLRTFQDNLSAPCSRTRAEEETLDCLILDGGSNRLSRDVDKHHTTFHNILEERRSHSHSDRNHIRSPTLVNETLIGHPAAPLRNGCR